MALRATAPRASESYSYSPARQPPLAQPWRWLLRGPPQCPLPTSSGGSSWWRRRMRRVGGCVLLVRRRGQRGVLAMPGPAQPAWTQAGTGTCTCPCRGWRCVRVPAGAARGWGRGGDAGKAGRGERLLDGTLPISWHGGMSEGALPDAGQGRGLCSTPGILGTRRCRAPPQGPRPRETLQTR